MSLRPTIRFVVSVLFALIIGPIIVLNVEELAKKHGLDQILVNNEGSAMLSLLQIAANHNYQLAAAVISGVFIGVWLDALAKRWDKKGQDETSPIQQLGRDMIFLAARWDNAKHQGTWRSGDDYSTLMPETLAILVRLGKLRITTYTKLKEELGAEWFESLSMYMRTVGHLLKDDNLRYARIADKGFMKDADR